MAKLEIAARELANAVDQLSEKLNRTLLNANSATQDRRSLWVDSEQTLTDALAEAKTASNELGSIVDGLKAVHRRLAENTGS